METKYLQTQLNILSLVKVRSLFIEIPFQTLVNYERKLPTKTRYASERTAMRVLVSFTCYIHFFGVFGLRIFMNLKPILT